MVNKNNKKNSPLSIEQQITLSQNPRLQRVRETSNFFNNIANDRKAQDNLRNELKQRITPRTRFNKISRPQQTNTRRKK